MSWNKSCKKKRRVYNCNLNVYILYKKKRKEKKNKLIYLKRQI